jgi:hypothetical protein
MKNINLLRHLRYKPNMTSLCRTKNDWDPAKLYPDEPVDEHVEPKKEDIIREIFDKNYYKFGFKGKQSDEHYPIDAFDEFRQWQHLYVHPR